MKQAVSKSLPDSSNRAPSPTDQNSFGTAVKELNSGMDSLTFGTKNVSDGKPERDQTGSPDKPNAPPSPLINTDAAPVDSKQSAVAPLSPSTSSQTKVAINEDKSTASLSLHQQSQTDQPDEKEDDDVADATITDVHSPQSQDVDMADDSPSVAGKTRGRDEEEPAPEPAPKRAKTEVEEAPTEAPEPKATPAKAPANSNSTGSSYVDELMEKKHWDSEPVTDAQSKFLLDQIRKAKKTNKGNWYRDPVDPEKLNIPTYFDYIKKPMDLTKIESNLKAGVYTSTDNMMEDFDQMIINSKIFNGPQHPVTQAGYDLKAYFVKLMALLPDRDQVSVKKNTKPAAVAVARPNAPRRGSRSKSIASTPAPVSQPKSQPTPSSASSFALLPDGVPLIRRASVNADRPKREIHRPPPRDLPYSEAKPQKKKYALELRFSKRVINSLFKAQHQNFAYPFLAPVDPIALNIPDYFMVVKNPMDFRTIKEKIANNGYTKAQEVYDDSQLVFANCFKYNQEGTPVCAMGKQLQRLFESEWEKKDEWLAQHAPPPPEPEEEEEEESEEESEFTSEEERQARLKALQDEMAKLQAEYLRILSLPPRNQIKTKGRPRKNKADAKSKVKPKKPAKKDAKPKAIPTLTMEEKQQIAEYIETLDPASDTMQTVIMMIRSGMPNVTEEDDIEISVEDIPNTVLYDLQQFIHKQTGYVDPPEPEVDEEDYDDDSDYVLGKKGKSGRGKSRNSRGSASGGPGRKKGRSSKSVDGDRQMIEAALSRFNRPAQSPPESVGSSAVPFVPTVESSDDESESESEEE